MSEQYPLSLYQELTLEYFKIITSILKISSIYTEIYYDTFTKALKSTKDIYNEWITLMDNRFDKELRSDRFTHALTDYINSYVNLHGIISKINPYMVRYIDIILEQIMYIAFNSYTSNLALALSVYREELAHTIIDVYSKSKRNKPVLTSLMGQWEAHEILNKYGIPTYDTPEQAVKTFMYMYQYKNRLELLDDSPEPYTSIATSTIITSDKKARLLSIINNALNEGRVILNEVEAKEFISCYNIPTVKTLVAKDEDSAVDIANMLGYPVVLKILSPDIVHKTDVGGVILDLKNEQEVRYAYREIMSNVKMKKPDARILGVTVQPMVSKRGIEVILGSKHDPIFGPVILFGMGGVGVEIFKDFTLELPPLNSKLARSMIEGTKVYNLLKGYRGMPAADVSKLEEVMLSFSNMLIDFPQIREVDMNPIIVYMDNITVLDARIVI
jgi:acetyltransferase